MITSLLELREKANKVRQDSGATFRLDVDPADYRINGVKQADAYDIRTDHSTIGPCTFNAAWSLLIGVDLGLRLAKETG